MLSKSVRGTVIKVSAIAFGSALAIAGIGVAGAVGSDPAPVRHASAETSGPDSNANETVAASSAAPAVEETDATETDHNDGEHAAGAVTPAGGACADEAAGDHEEEGNADHENECEEDDDAPGSSANENENSNKDDKSETADQAHKSGEKASDQGGNDSSDNDED